MARITVEDCIDKFESRFELVLVASNRARKLHSGESPTVDKNNDKNTVIALREIADESIEIEKLKENLVEEYQTVTSLDDEDLSLENLSSEDENNIDDVSEKQVDLELSVDDNTSNDNNTISENNSEITDNESYVDNNEDNNL